MLGRRELLARGVRREDIGRLTTNSRTFSSAPSLHYRATRNEDRNQLNEGKSRSTAQLPQNAEQWVFSPCPMMSSVVRESHPVTLTSGCADGSNVNSSYFHFGTSCGYRDVSHRHPTERCGVDVRPWTLRLETWERTHSVSKRRTSAP